MTTGTFSRRRPLVGVLGPALVAGVAYLDPGNVATNLAAGSQYGYLLVWVLVGANLAAWLFQFLSAKLGLVTGQSLPRLLGVRIKSVLARRLFWVQAEIVVIATDVAEVVGGAIALKLLTGLPLLFGGLLTSALSLLLVALRRYGNGRFNAVVIGLLLVTAVGFSFGIIGSPVNLNELAGGLIPGVADGNSLMLATSMIGATIMPHAIYAHSSLSRDSAVGPLAGIPRILRLTKLDVTLALVIAGLGNLAILVVAAANLSGSAAELTIARAFELLTQQLGVSAGLVFAVALLASGLASSAVGNYAASEISAGLLRKKMSPLRRWLIAMVPALLILALAPNVTSALIFSQVVLSIGLPFALYPLVRFTACRKLMGSYANQRKTTVVGYGVATILTGLNITMVAIMVMGYQ